MITEVPLMAQVVVYASHDSFRCVKCRVFCRALSRPTKDLLIIRGSLLIIRGSLLIIRGSLPIIRGSLLIIRGSLLIIATSKVVVYASHDSFRCVT